MITGDEPRCPHGCRPTKPMQWVDDQWCCRECGAEWADETVRPSGEDESARPVWLKRRHIEFLNRLQLTEWQRSHADEIVDAWDAAPTDSVELLRVVVGWPRGYHGEEADMAAAVLHALGYPEVAS